MQCSSTAFICTANQITACARAAVIVQSGSRAGGGGRGDQRQGGSAAGVLPILECAAHRRQQVIPILIDPLAPRALFLCEALPQPAAVLCLEPSGVSQNGLHTCEAAMSRLWFRIPTD